MGKEAALLEAELVLATPDEKLRAVGLSFAKIASIKDLARKTIDGVVPPYEILHTLADEEIIERLTQVRGIGRWTVEMLLMFAARPARRAADRRLRRAQWIPARLWTARHADAARARGIRRALGAVSLGRRVVPVARRRPAPGRQTTRARDAHAHQDREERKCKSREEPDAQKPLRRKG